MLAKFDDDLLGKLVFRPVASVVNLFIANANKNMATVMISRQTEVKRPSAHFTRHWQGII